MGDNGSPGDDAAAQASNKDCSPNNGTVARGSKFSCVARLHRLVVVVRSSPQHRNEFQRLCAPSGATGKGLIRDVRTRWNSTYSMIKRACELRGPLSGLAKSDSAFSALGDEEWDLEVVAQVLGIFEEASQPLCADSYPTLNRAVLTYECLFKQLEGFLGMRNEDDDG